MSDFDDRPWHDAVLLKVDLDRTDPGNVDELRILIEWPNDAGRSWITFADCYSVAARLNLGIVGPETVLAAVELPEDDDLPRLRAKWAKVGVDLSRLRCFAIETNATASRWLIHALTWRETPAA